MNKENESTIEEDSNNNEFFEFISNLKKENYEKEYEYHYKNLKDAIEKNNNFIDNLYTNSKLNEKSNDNSKNITSLEDLNIKDYSNETDKTLIENANNVNQMFDEFESYINKQIYWNLMKLKISSVIDQLKVD